MLSGTTTGICTFGAYTDGTLVPGGFGTTFTWSYNTVASAPTTGSELFTVIRVPTVAVSLSIRLITCTGGGSYSAISGTKVLIEQISIT